VPRHRRPIPPSGHVYVCWPVSPEKATIAVLRMDRERASRRKLYKYYDLRRWGFIKRKDRRCLTQRQEKDQNVSAHDNDSRWVFCRAAQGWPAPAASPLRNGNLSKVSTPRPRLRKNHHSCSQIPSPDRQRCTTWSPPLFWNRGHRRRGTSPARLDQSQSNDGSRARNGAFCLFPVIVLPVNWVTYVLPFVWT
jgi:hypothetical protein